MKILFIAFNSRENWSAFLLVNWLGIPLLTGTTTLTNTEYTGLASADLCNYNPLYCVTVEMCKYWWWGSIYKLPVRLLKVGHQQLGLEEGNLSALILQRCTLCSEYNIIPSWFNASQFFYCPWARRWPILFTIPVYICKFRRPNFAPGWPLSQHYYKYEYSLRMVWEMRVVYLYFIH